MKISTAEDQAEEALAIDAIDNHEGVKGLRSLVAKLNAELDKVKAEGQALSR